MLRLIPPTGSIGVCVRQRGFKRVSTVRARRRGHRAADGPRRGSAAAAGPARACGRAATRSHDGGPGAAQRPRPGRVVDGHRRASRERRAADLRRAADAGRRPGSHGIRHRWSTSRPSPTRRTSCTRSRRASVASSRSAWSTAPRRSRPPRRVLGPRHRAAGRRHRGRATRARSSATSTSCRTRTTSSRSPCGLTPADLPERVEAWGALDRLIWQDIDATALDADQLAALRGWIAGGGRLVIVGGTAGPASPVGVPRRHPPLPSHDDDRRRGVVARGAARPDPGRRDRPAGAGRRAGGRSSARQRR